MGHPKVVALRPTLRLDEGPDEGWDDSLGPIESGS